MPLPFTHWFQPLTGTTAEKHDSFFMPKNGSGIEEFSADALVQQEPGSIFFSFGGIRVTFDTWLYCMGRYFTGIHYDCR
ncbi:MAG: glutamine synthetase III [Chitinophagales bacterium]